MNIIQLTTIAFNTFNSITQTFGNLSFEDFHDIIVKDDNENLKKVLNVDDKKILNPLLFYSIASGADKCCKFLIDNVEDVNKTFIMGNTFLQTSTEFNNFLITYYLLEKGANPNTVTKNGMSPLLNSINNVNLNIYFSLIEFGADNRILIRDFDCVLESKLYTIVEELISKMDVFDSVKWNLKNKYIRFSDMIPFNNFILDKIIIMNNSYHSYMIL